MRKIKKCPRCGSKDVVEILYGYPTYEARKLAREKKLYLSGCIVSDLNPTHHCNGCGKNIGTPPLVYNKKDSRGVPEGDYRDFVSYIKYERQGFFYGQDIVVMKKKEDVFLLDAQKSEYGFIVPGQPLFLDVHRQLTEKEWRHVLDRLYTKVYLHEWKHWYHDAYVCDGMTYQLTIKLSDGRRRVYEWATGSEPPYFGELERTFIPFLKENKVPASVDDFSDCK